MCDFVSSCRRSSLASLGGWIRDMSTVPPNRRAALGLAAPLGVCAAVSEVCTKPKSLNVSRGSSDRGAGRGQLFTSVQV